MLILTVDREGHWFIAASTHKRLAVMWNWARYQTRNYSSYATADTDEESPVSAKYVKPEGKSTLILQMGG
jgi:hypothetical protein